VKPSYDPDTDSAYISLVDDLDHGNAVKQVVCRDDSLWGPIVVDLDPEGHVIGFEFANTSAMLPRRFLDKSR